jgi:hypothetical protein
MIPMPSPFESRVPSLNGPARDFVPVTPSDSADLANVAVSLYVTVAGTLVVDTVAGNTRTLEVGDFALLPLGVRRVRATGTTASGIHALVV